MFTYLKHTSLWLSNGLLERKLVSIITCYVRFQVLYMFVVGCLHNLCIPVGGVAGDLSMCIHCNSHSNQSSNKWKYEISFGFWFSLPTTCSQFYWIELVWVLSSYFVFFSDPAVYSISWISRTFAIQMCTRVSMWHFCTPPNSTCVCNVYMYMYYVHTMDHFWFQECGSDSSGDVDRTETIPPVWGEDECHIWTRNENAVTGEVDICTRLFWWAPRIPSYVYCMVSDHSRLSVRVLLKSTFLSTLAGSPPRELQ